MMRLQQIQSCSRRKQAGFTLVELLVVMVILGLLVTLATPQIMKHLGHAKTQTARIEIKNMQTALDLFRIDVGRYPTAQEGLDALQQKPHGVDTWRGPYLEKKAGIVDPWGTAYVYRIPGKNGDYDILSYGADKAESGTGESADVTN